jgi:hypothetical protein
MPVRETFVVGATPRVIAILSTITLLTLTGCGSDSDRVQESPAAITDSGAAPSITGTPGSSILADEAYSFTPSASDPNGDRLTFEIQNMPPWASFDPTNGRLTGTPTAAQVGTYSNVTISVSDGRNRVSLPAFSIAVSTAVSGRATLSWTAPTQRADGSALQLGGYRIYYGNSPNLYNRVISVTNAGLTTFVVENLAAGTWHFVIAAVDSSGMESEPSNSATLTIS